MSVIIGGSMGVFIGVTLFALVSATTVNDLKNKVKKYKKLYRDEKFKVTQRDILMEDCQKQIEILLICALEDKRKMQDLENNIELLIYNVPELKNELVDNIESDN